MIKIHNCFSRKFRQTVKKGQVRLSHFPNGMLGWAARNKIGQYLVFSFGNNNGEPPKIVMRFANSTREWN